jgi:hypothetical protein
MHRGPQSKGQQKSQIIWIAERRDPNTGALIVLFGVEHEINLILQ